MLIVRLFARFLQQLVGDLPQRPDIRDQLVRGRATQSSVEELVSRRIDLVLSPLARALNCLMPAVVQ